ncbi:MAG: CHAT domain-containing protein [Ignavibacteria bacterium]|nr:CHAT domain-containing protein [Ignavibacteria bacterium]
MSKNLNASKFTVPDACEDALMTLSGENSASVLHIATHGFFFPEPEKKYDEFTTGNTGSKLFATSGNPLKRSGIVLSGANNFWRKGEKNETTSDGIITAEEIINNLNLENTEFVLLSACETGLGDIKGGEGVYGLQRAFQLAGAKAMIMSLWKVPDEKTALLMNSSTPTGWEE